MKKNGLEFMYIPET